MIGRIVLVLFALSATLTAAGAADLKVLTTGAMKPVLLEVVPGFQQDSKQTVSLDNDTAGALLKRIQGGAAFDVSYSPRPALTSLPRPGRSVPGLSWRGSASV